MTLEGSGCSSYIRWRLIYEYLCNKPTDQAQETLTNIFGYEIISENDVQEWYSRFKIENQTFDKIAHKHEFDHIQFLYEVKNNSKFFEDAQKKKPKNIDKETQELSKLSDAELIEFRRSLIQDPAFCERNYEFGKIFAHMSHEIDGWEDFWHDSISVLTPICFIITFTPKMDCGVHFPTPTDFDPPTNPFTRLFEESYLITKTIFRKMQNRRMSLHEILCDMYDCDPKRTWLSDEDIFMLPLFFGTTNNHAENLASDLCNCKSNITFNQYFTCLTADNLNVWDSKSNQQYAEAFTSRILKIYENMTEDFTNSQSLVKFDKDSTQKDIFLCGFYAFLEAYMKNLILGLNRLKGLDVLSYYSRVWKTLIEGLNEIVIQLQRKFSRPNQEEFARVLKLSMKKWKQIFFHDDLLPRLVKQIYNDAKSKNLDMSYLITPEIIQSYKMLKIYDTLDITDIGSIKATKYDYYKFMKWHIDTITHSNSLMPKTKLHLMNDQNQDDDVDMIEV